MANNRFVTSLRLAWLILTLLIFAQWLWLSIRTLSAGLVLLDTLYTFVMPLGFFVLAGLIFVRRSDDPMAIITSLMLVFVGPYLIGGIGSEFMVLSGWYYPTGLLEIIGTLVLLTFLFRFPNGKLRPRWGGWLIVGVGVTALIVLPLVFAEDIFIYIFLIASLVGVGAQAYRFRVVSTAAERQQAKWVAVGALGPIASMGWWFFVLLPHGILSTANASGFYLFSVLLGWLLPFLLPLGIAISILRYRLWDIDIIIRRTLIYSMLTVLLGMMYLGGVVILQSLFVRLTGQAQSQLVTVVTTLLIAALFLPLRSRVQNFIDRRFYRRKYDASKTLADFAEAARDEVELETLTGKLVQVVDETMQPTGASLWLKSTKR